MVTPSASGKSNSCGGVAVAIGYNSPVPVSRILTHFEMSLPTAFSGIIRISTLPAWMSNCVSVAPLPMLRSLPKLMGPVISPPVSLSRFDYGERDIIQHSVVSVYSQSTWVGVLSLKSTLSRLPVGVLSLKSTLSRLGLTICRFAAYPSGASSHHLCIRFSSLTAAKLSTSHAAANCGHTCPQRLPGMSE